jgi:uncharacterized membrane protein YeiH
MAALFGMLTGIGGGVARDVLLAQVPLVLRADLYAVAALGGATVVVLGDQFGAPPVTAALCGAAFCFLLRVLAIKRGWQLPKALQQPRQNSNATGSKSGNDHKDARL